ncbi:uncharacterized protein [Hetaerina americana]|uniref:uncharacterized protein n=1 Tax=Hetaerina americana TaxID=62018 RepID=UPI003A7F1AFB
MWRMISVRIVEKTIPVNFSKYLSTSNVLFKSHYDVLGLTPKATQSDIKAAYYKLSMIYHPDKNKESSASSTFRDITTAYEVLGNYKLRKLYDRGLLHTPGVEATDDYEHPEAKFYQSRASRHSAPAHSGKTPIYDFDEWARRHYGQSFAKRAEAKLRWEAGGKKRPVIKGEVQSEVMVFLILFVFAPFIVFSYTLSEAYDVDRTQDLAPKRSGNSLES